MDLKTYLSPMTGAERDEFAALCETTRGHLQNVAYGKTCSPALATAIELHSSAAVTRVDMRPNDFWRIWPDLEPPKRRERIKAL